MWIKGCLDTNCIEVWQSACCADDCTCSDSVKIRDSKNPDGPVLNFSRDEWNNFKAGVASGVFG